MASPLQAARREVQRVRELLESQARCPHELFQHRVRKAGADRLSQIPIARQCASQGTLSAQLLYHRSKFVCHLSSIVATIGTLIKRDDFAIAQIRTTLLQ